MDPAKLVQNLKGLLDRGPDTALLRFSLGSAYLNANDPQHAVAHLRAALNHDPEYSAAWKFLGKALSQTGDNEAARDAYRQGIAIAERRGDVQAAKEMRVFIKRLDR